MIVQDMQRSLLRDVLSATGEPTGYLCALVDRAAITAAQRNERTQKFADHSYPLIVEPGYEQAVALSAMLIAPTDDSRQAQYDFIDQLQTYNSDVISVWITSVLPVEELARHLRQATFARNEQGKAYWLRYYDPVITPILYGEAPDEWQRWFFGPVISWWFAQPTSQKEQWHQMAGFRTRPAAPVQYVPEDTSTHAPQLILTQTLWDKLQSDPIPYQLLQALETEGSARFDSECRGMRLAQVKELLGEAQQIGFADTDQHDYVWLALHHYMPQIRRHDNWKFVRTEVLAGKGRLRHLVQQHITG